MAKSNRVSSEELEKSVFVPIKKNHVAGSNDQEIKQQIVETFDKSGVKQTKLASDQIAAKKFIIGRNTDYFAKINVRNELYDPHNKYYEHESLSLAKRQGLEPFKLIKISKEGFENYIQYLQSKNPLFLQQANRGI